MGSPRETKLLEFPRERKKGSVDGEEILGVSVGVIVGASEGEEGKSVGAPDGMMGVLVGSSVDVVGKAEGVSIGTGPFKCICTYLGRWITASDVNQ